MEFIKVTDVKYRADGEGRMGVVYEDRWRSSRITLSICILWVEFLGIWALSYILYVTKQIILIFL